MRYNYNMELLFFSAGYGNAFMDRYEAKLDKTPFYSEGGFYVALTDLARIFSPDWEWSVTDGTVTVNHGGAQASCPAAEFDGTAMADVKLLLGQGLGKAMLETKEFICFGNKGAVELDPRTGPQHHVYSMLRGKNKGDLFRTYWNEDFKKLLPYRLFIPYNYDPATPTKLILGLHGGGGNPNRIFEISKNMMQFYANKYGYIILSVDGGIYSASYGCPYPIAGARDVELPQPENRENPLGYSPEELVQRSWCEKGVMHNLEIVRQQYNIDADRMYLFGNSMGGIGTLYLGDRHGELFRAFAPAGAMIDTDYFRGDGLGDKPVYFVGGMEDFHGFDFLDNGCKKLKEYGRNITFNAVGGGGHSEAWVMALDTIFDFFNANS